jgi:hypothetical protein
VSIWKDNDWLLTFASYNTSGPLAPSSHEMRYNPFLGSMNPKTQKMRKWMGRKMEGGKYGREFYNDSSRSYLVATLFLRVTNLLGHNDNHQGEMRKKV